MIARRLVVVLLMIVTYDIYLLLFVKKVLLVLILFFWGGGVFQTPKNKKHTNSFCNAEGNCEYLNPLIYIIQFVFLGITS